MQPTPLVSIGMPVFNGDKFLAKALDSLLTQTFHDFELIISDNASTDQTERICREYAERDSRITYHRNSENMGAGWNIRRVCELARGKYFKWAAHDDFCAPTYLERCVSILEAKPEVVVAHSKTRVVDQDGNVIEDYEWPMRLDDNDPIVRFKDLLLNDHLCFPIFGVMRLAALRRVPPQGSYVNSDGVLLAQMGLLGPYAEIPERLWINTRHPGQSMQNRPSRLKQSGFRLTRRHGTLPSPEWWDPKQSRRITFPEWRQLVEYAKSLGLVRLSFWQKLRAYPLLLVWVYRHFRRMLKDLLIAADQFVYNYQTRDLAKHSQMSKTSAVA
jgi:glycosyltransferase involved in cell wall biosynthesis